MRTTRAVPKLQELCQHVAQSGRRGCCASLPIRKYASLKLNTLCKPPLSATTIYSKRRLLVSDLKVCSQRVGQQVIYVLSHTHTQTHVREYARKNVEQFIHAMRTLFERAQNVRPLAPRASDNL